MMWAHSSHTLSFYTIGWVFSVPLFVAVIRHSICTPSNLLWNPTIYMLLSIWLSHSLLLSLSLWKIGSGIFPGGDGRTTVNWNAIKCICKWQWILWTIVESKWEFRIAYWCALTDCFHFIWSPNAIGRNILQKSSFSSQKTCPCPYLSSATELD